MPNRFQPLIDHLAGRAEPEVTLTFQEIAKILGQPLPEAAILRAAWWTNKALIPVRLWQAQGWHAHADRDQLRVRFTRDVGAG